MTKIEEIKYNQYVRGKITLKELLDWHDDYKKREAVKNEKVA